MFTIALDEQGDFENLQQKLDKNPVFIGGIIYDDKENNDDYENEKIRLQKYLQWVCESVQCNYPQDLHFYKNAKGNNGKKVAAVKKQISRTIKEFIENATWNNKEIISPKRIGEYFVFASIRGENGKQRLLDKNVSEAVKDDFASNLYVHMAEDVVGRLVFHNPIIRDIKKVRLELATRRVVLSGAYRNERKNQYEQLGFREIQRDYNRSQGITEFLLTNSDNYRTAFEREMLSCNQEKILVDRITVKSIYYEHQTNGMDFLYLSDAICSLLGFQIKGHNASEWIKEFYERSQSINANKKNIIWAYDEIDDYYAKAWHYGEEKDYYKALSVLFDGYQVEGEMSSFYKEKWFPYIQKYIENQNDVSAFSMAVKKYRDSVHNNNLNQEKILFIFLELEKMSQMINFSSKKEESELYDLYDSGLSAYIHNGDLDGAKRCFDKAIQYAEYIATELYLRTRNKMVVFLCDKLKFEEALQLADKNVFYHELLSNMKMEMFEQQFTEAVNHGIAFSQRAQVYAFLRNIKAEVDFKNALKIMDEGTPDRYITLSYLLHFYIDQGWKNQYELYAKEYFGNEENLENQFLYIATEGAKEKNAVITLKYALYVYVKAIYTFYRHEIPNSLVCKLKNIENALEDVNPKAWKQFNGHPWEIIFKYLALIMIDEKFYKEKDIYKLKLVEKLEKSQGLIRDICQESIKNIEENELKSKYTYMYC